MDVTKLIVDAEIDGKVWDELPLPYKMIWFAYEDGLVSKGQASKACKELDELYIQIEWLQTKVEELQAANAREDEGK